MPIFWLTRPRCLEGSRGLMSSKAQCPFLPAAAACLACRRDRPLASELSRSPAPWCERPRKQRKQRSARRTSLSGSGSARSAMPSTLHGRRGGGGLHEQAVQLSQDDPRERQRQQVENNDRRAACRRGAGGPACGTRACAVGLQPVVHGRPARVCIPPRLPGRPAHGLVVTGVLTCAQLRL